MLQPVTCGAGCNRRLVRLNGKTILPAERIIMYFDYFTSHRNGLAPGIGVKFYSGGPLFMFLFWFVGIHRGRRPPRALDATPVGVAEK